VIEIPPFMENIIQYVKKHSKFYQFAFDLSA